MTITNQMDTQLGYWERYYRDYPYGRYCSQIEKRAVLHVRDLVGRPAAALDVGCESGRWSELLAQRGWRLTCTDISSEALALCQGRLPDARCLLVTPEDTTLPVPDASQDAVLCVEVPMVLQSEWFIAEAARVLAPGGYLVGVHYNPHSLRGLLYTYVPGFRSKRRTALFCFTESYVAWRSRLLAAGVEMIDERGFGWIPFRKFNRSPLVTLSLDLERRLGLGRVARFGAMVVFVARKRAGADSSPA
ncbi:MAG TPA: class I SAM-dependent methyltransferase [Ktedonobacterales bacterium]